jgi:hypothetical protein
MNYRDYACKTSTALVSLMALAPASPALAQEACGPAEEGGTITCAATEEPYTGLRYESVTDFTLLLEEGVVVDASLSDPETQQAGILVHGEGAISVVAEGNATVRGSLYPGMDVLSGSGPVTVRADQVYADIEGGTAISAIAWGDVDVSANHAEGQNGIVAESQDGNVSISVLTATGGWGGVGVWARTLASDISIDAREARVDGDYARGIYAATESGIVNIDAGYAFANGVGSHAISAEAIGNGNLNIRAGNASAMGEGSAAIVAISSFGGIDIAAGSAYQTGDYGVGIGAYAMEEGSVRLSVEQLATQGEFSRGVDIAARYDVTLEVGDLATHGSESNGVNVETTGTVVADIGAIRTYGLGSYGMSIVTGDAVDVEIGSIDTHGESSAALYVQGDTGAIDARVGTAISHAESGDFFLIGINTGAGNISLTVEEAARTATGVAITTASYEGTVTINVAEGASVYGSRTAINSATAAGTRINIAGTVESLTGPVIEIVNEDADGIADIRIAATGQVLGTILFDDRSDTLTNAGAFLTSGESDFGGGNDRFANSGTIALRDDQATAISLAGLERLDNDGTISLVNGRTGDTLTLDGTLHGAAGSELAVDLDLVNGETDLIAVNDLSGTSALHLNILGRTSGLGLDGLRVITSQSQETGEELVLAPESEELGFVRFALEYDGRDGWVLATDLNDAAYLGGAMAAGVRDLWHLGVDALSTHLLATRENEDAAGVWIQAVGSDLKSKSSLSHSRGSRDLAWNGSHEGVQLGGEKRFGGWQVGFTAGYGSARLSLGKDDHSRFGIFNAGVYASYARDGWFGGAMLRADLVDIESNWTSIGLEDKGDGTTIGVNLEGGYRTDLGGVWFEPALRLSWVNVSLPGQEGEYGDVRWESGSGVSGDIGLRIGAREEWLGIPLRPFLTMSLTHDFGGGDEAVIDLGTEEARVSARDGRTYGRFGGGLGYTAGRVDLYTEVDGRFGDIEGVSGVIGARMRF